MQYTFLNVYKVSVFHFDSLIPGKKEKVNAGLKELDKDGNGLISFEELMRWLRWIPIDE